jgi:hypothetical protein
MNQHMPEGASAALCGNSAAPQQMKVTVTITSRGAVTLPAEMYTPERVREFDAAERELAAYLGAKAPVARRADRSKRKPAR